MSLSWYGVAIGSMLPAARARAHHPRRVIPAHPRGSHNRPMRKAGIAVLLAAGTLFWIGFGLGVWGERQALDTEQWVDTSGELLENEPVRTALGLFIVDRLFDSEEVQAR